MIALALPGCAQTEEPAPTTTALAGESASAPEPATSDTPSPDTPTHEAPQGQVPTTVEDDAEPSGQALPDPLPVADPQHWIRLGPALVEYRPNSPHSGYVTGSSPVITPSLHELELNVRQIIASTVAKDDSDVTGASFTFFFGEEGLQILGLAAVRHGASGLTPEEFAVTAVVLDPETLEVVVDYEIERSATEPTAIAVGSWEDAALVRVTTRAESGRGTTQRLIEASSGSTIEELPDDSSLLGSDFGSAVLKTPSAEGTTGTCGEVQIYNITTGELTFSREVPGELRDPYFGDCPAHEIRRNAPYAVLPGQYQQPGLVDLSIGSFDPDRYFLDVQDGTSLGCPSDLDFFDWSSGLGLTGAESNFLDKDGTPLQVWDCRQGNVIFELTGADRNALEAKVVGLHEETVYVRTTDELLALDPETGETSPVTTYPIETIGDHHWLDSGEFAPAGP